MDKKMQIRNSTADFLVFTKENREDSIEVRVHDEDVWLTQKSMAQLFECSTDNIGLHLKNIFASGELDAIISVGYRINSIRATQFRQWTIPLQQQLRKIFLPWYRISCIMRSITIRLQR